jgi:hypothetical protein
MKALVTGGRDFADAEYVAKVLDSIHDKEPFREVIHGDARGLDRIAGAWATMNGINVRAMPADWARHGRAAGPQRNARMLLQKPDVLIAFPGGKGTADMVQKATLAGVRVVFATDVVPHSARVE